MSVQGLRTVRDFADSDVCDGGVPIDDVDNNGI